MAEVLITLGIIGVVAALTMPTLIAKFQQKSFETAFKKQYSVLNNTIDFLVLDQELRECYVTVIPDPSNPTGNTVYSSNLADCAALKQGMISKLKLQTIEKDFSYPSQQKVFAEGGVSANSNVGYDDCLSGMKSYLVPDGAVVMFTEGGSGGYCTDFVVVDVNGKKGPNRWGYDVFWLTLAKYKDKIRLTDEYASLSEKGGSLPRNILLNKWGNDFDRTSSWGIWK